MTEQVPDRVRIDGIGWSLIDGIDVRGAFDGWPPPHPTSWPHTACYRGWVAGWTIRDGRLWLAGLTWYTRRGMLAAKDLFPGRPLPIFAEWVSAELSLQGSEWFETPSGYQQGRPIWRIIAVERGMVVEDRSACPIFGSLQMLYPPGSLGRPALDDDLARLRSLHAEWYFRWGGRNGPPERPRVYIPDEIFMSGADQAATDQEQDTPLADAEVDEPAPWELGILRAVVLRLRVVSGPPGQPCGDWQVMLADRAVKIGRVEGNDLVLPGDPTISRHHCTIEPDKGAWRIIVTGCNDVEVNHRFVERTETRRIEAGDELGVGGYVLRVEAVDSKAR